MKDTMLIFDLDGTLWDSGDNVARSWNKVINKRAPELKLLTGDDIRSVMGKTMEEIAEILFPDYPADRRAEFYSECQEYENEYIAIHGGNLFPEVRETLSNLKNAGYRMAIVSNCQRGYIPAFLKSMEMKEFFIDIEEWGNTMKSKAENIRLVMDRNDVFKAVYIGDTRKDMEASQEAGIPFIFARYGFGVIPEAEICIDSFSELPKALPEIR